MKPPDAWPERGRSGSADPPAERLKVFVGDPEKVSRDFDAWSEKKPLAKLTDTIACPATASPFMPSVPLVFYCVRYVDPVPATKTGLLWSMERRPGGAMMDLWHFHRDGDVVEASSPRVGLVRITLCRLQIDGDRVVIRDEPTEASTANVCAICAREAR